MSCCSSTPAGWPATVWPSCWSSSTSARPSPSPTGPTCWPPARSSSPATPPRSWSSRTSATSSWDGPPTRARTGARLPVADVDVLDLSVGGEFVEALLAADAGVLEAAEGGAGEVAGGVVDPDVAGFDVVGEAVGGGQVAGEDTGGEAIADAVGDGDRLLVAGHWQHRQDRAEDLLLGQAGVGADLVEQGGAQEHAAGVGRVLHRAAASCDPGAFGAADLQVLEHLLVLAAVDDRAGVGGLGGGRAGLQGVDAAGELLDELAVDRCVDQQARGGAAGLPLPGEVHTAQGALDGEVQVGVGQHHDRVLAAQLQGDGLDHVDGGALLDGTADLGRTDEGEAA